MQAFRKVGGVEMETAKNIPKNQEKLNITEEDKVVFIEQDGNIIIANSGMLALEKIQNEFVGEAERLGLKNEEDVVNLVKEVREDKS